MLYNSYGTCGCGNMTTGCGSANLMAGCNWGCGANFIEELINFFVVIIVLESVLGLFCNILP